MNLLLDALAFAAAKHRNQRRKDVGASPYINHPIALARVLSVEAGIHDETVIAAALLHDTIEDTETWPKPGSEYSSRRRAHWSDEGFRLRPHAETVL
jgi:GTP diphosphokinase / guanosine-3',5'-bis(diphosphate) 3'-diphosphatase